MVGPRVEVIDGKIVIQESSLELDPLAGHHDIEQEYEEVEEGIFAGSRYSSFLPTRHKKKWSLEETTRFYKVFEITPISTFSFSSDEVDDLSFYTLFTTLFVFVDLGINFRLLDSVAWSFH